MIWAFKKVFKTIVVEVKQKINFRYFCILFPLLVVKLYNAVAEKYLNNELQILCYN